MVKDEDNRPLVQSDLEHIVKNWVGANNIYFNIASYILKKESQSYVYDSGFPSGTQ